MSDIRYAFSVRGVAYTLHVLDEDDSDLDPTLLIFRNGEDEAVIGAHLVPGTTCRDGHVVVPDCPYEPDECAEWRHRWAKGELDYIPTCPTHGGFA